MTINIRLISEQEVTIPSQTISQRPPVGHQTLRPLPAYIPTVPLPDPSLAGARAAPSSGRPSHGTPTPLVQPQNLLGEA